MASPLKSRTALGLPGPCIKAGDVDLGPPKLVGTPLAFGPESVEDAASTVQDEVERAIAQLEQTVQACRGQPLDYLEADLSAPLFAASPTSFSPSTYEHWVTPPVATTGDGLGEEFATSPLARTPLMQPPPVTDVLLLDDHEPLSMPAGGAAQEALEALEALGKEAREDDEENYLEAEALALRTELRRADARLQAALAEAQVASAAVRESDDRHALWLRETEDAVAKLRKDNRRLERSSQQAALEERRLTDILRDAPEKTHQILTRVQGECCRLEEENKRLESEAAVVGAELGYLRDVVSRDTRRSGSHSRPMDSLRSACRQRAGVEFDVFQARPVLGGRQVWR